MEPHATLAVWDKDGTLTVYDSTQMVGGTKKIASLVLGIPEEKINVVCEFLGGGFGGKSWSWPHTLLAALAAKVVNRPVRLQLTRAQMYAMVGHQPATVQTITLGADRDGKLTGIRHDSVNPTSVFDDYVEYAALASRHLWRASGGISTSHSSSTSTATRPSCCARPWRHKAISRSNAPWMSWHTLPVWIRWSCACATMLTPTHTAAAPFPRAPSVDA
jgi:xanthine dehydrogenase YagR molybdenum-binding subunit